MYLTSQAIKDEVRNGTICIDDFNEAQLQPNGYNLRLDREMIVYRQAVLNPRMQNKYERFAIPDEGFVLRPGKLYVGRTVEHIRALRHVPVMSGRYTERLPGMFLHHHRKSVAATKGTSLCPTFVTLRVQTHSL